jgi:hypothetical protein
MNSQKAALFSIAYLPPIQYYSALVKYSEISIEHYEHFVKQTYRNRCYIYGTNGKLALTIPIEKRSERTITKDIRISYTYDWQKVHWRSIESAYRCSPFFEFYEDDFVKFFLEEKNIFLVDHNEKLFLLINSLLKIKVNLKKTDRYEKEYIGTDDYRNTISPKINGSPDINFSPKVYKQVFDNKYGFINNLSIIDLLFNQGPNSADLI